ncbi:DNA-binding protein [Clostridioides difficile]|nr:DNA-binding protein [Clostridioides difficile]EHJ32410.1 hypothetical protein HMPREF1123_00741 [Clostridioides difficile 050-P50-2011]EHJ32598.1 hypothetical protein HMPREF1122_01001 [Clostridioides difficile 002-P50-2011]EQG24164.1 hypothetical protein QIG_0330 [Clostridioides difficile DA00065]EQK26423.1 hypothetical protein QUY_0325 [Clostridioides difficile P71]
MLINYKEKSIGNMEYMHCPEIARKHGISERQVQKLCDKGRIPGVSKFEYVWLIPKDVEKPVDGKTKIRKELQYE